MSLGEALPTDRRPLSSELHVPTAPAAPPSRRGWACVCPVALCLRTPPPLPHPLVPEKAARGSPRLLLVRGLRLTGDVVPGCERLALGTSQAFVTALQRVRSWPCSRDPRMAGPVHCRHRRVGRGRSLPPTPVSYPLLPASAHRRSRVLPASGHHQARLPLFSHSGKRLVPCEDLGQNVKPFCFVKKI